MTRIALAHLRLPRAFGSLRPDVGSFVDRQAIIKEMSSQIEKLVKAAVSYGVALQHGLSCALD